MIFIVYYYVYTDSQTASYISLDYSTSYVAKDLSIQDLPTGAPITGNTYTINPSASTSVQNSKVTINFNEIADKLKAGAIVSFDFNLTHDQINGTTSTTCYAANDEFKNANFNLQLSITLDQDYSSPYDFFISSQFQDAFGTGISQYLMLKTEIL